MSAIAYATDRLTPISNILDAVKQLFQSSKERMSIRSTRTNPLFQPGDLVYLSTKALHSDLENANIQETNDWVMSK
jgi:hypothetical protein